MKLFGKKIKKTNNFEKTIAIDKETPTDVFYRIEKIFKPITKKVCSMTIENGKTICLILQEGLVEIHELKDKECTYICFTTPNKRIFEKFKKELTK